MQTLQAQGLQLVPSYSNRGLHPYALAMAEGAMEVWGKPMDGVLCVVRWPQPSKYPNMEMPIVVMKRGGSHMTLVARSAKEYVTRVLVEEDLKAGAPAIHCFHGYSLELVSALVLYLVLNIVAESHWFLL
jgi:hypothetical protein